MDGLDTIGPTDTAGCLPCLVTELGKVVVICKEIVDKDIDGIICTNTTVAHSYKFQGGLSGEQLFEISNRSLTSIRSFLGSSFPIIASGGVMSRHHFEKKLELGADLVQIYTGMIYKGPALVKDILNS